MLIFIYSFSFSDKNPEAKGSENVVQNLPQFDFFLLKMNFENQIFH